ncbi:hypothetical protein nvc1_138 [Namao virus]|nr:hypothetical protein nvc1_138 [Namao virus]
MTQTLSILGLSMGTANTNSSTDTIKQTLSGLLTDDTKRVKSVETADLELKKDILQVFIIIAVLIIMTLYWAGQYAKCKKFMNVPPLSVPGKLDESYKISRNPNSELLAV